MTDRSSHEQVVEDWYALFNGDFSKLDVAAESVEFTDPLGEARGRDEVEGFIREIYTAFPDMELSVEEMVADDDLAMVEWSVTATHEGELNGIPPTGREVAQRGMEKILISNDKVQESRIYFDQHELLSQLGLTGD